MDHSLSTHLPWHPDASVGISQGRGMVTSSPMEPHLQHEGLHQAKLSAPCGRGPDPITPKWALLTDVPTGGRTEAITSLGSPSHPGRGDGKGHWLQRNAGILQESLCPMGQTLHLEDLQRVMLSDLGPWKEDPGPEGKVARVVQAAAGSRQRCPGGLIGPNGRRCPPQLPMGVEQLCSRCPRHI